MRALQAEARVRNLRKQLTEYADRLIELERPKVRPKPDSPEVRVLMEKGENDE